MNESQPMMGALPADPCATVPIPNETGETAPQKGDTSLMAAVRCRCEVVSVEQTPMPSGAQGADWCRYVLSCGNSRITGLHRGTLDEVMAFAVNCVEDFNRRSATGKGMAGVAYTKKKALMQPQR